jgi:hypothetical protein
MLIMAITLIAKMLARGSDERLEHLRAQMITFGRGHWSVRRPG